MIGYEGVNRRDFSLYFQEAWAWWYDSKQDVVKPAFLTIYLDDEDADELIEDTSVGVEFIASAHGVREVNGYALTRNPEYIIHRFELEYVPLSPTRVIRVSLEPNDRRAFKGARYDFVRTLPLLDGVVHKKSNRVLRALGEVITYPEMPPEEAELMTGIAQVLTVGLAPCMRRNIGSEEATGRARAAVRAMFEDDEQTVCVPTFSTALIRAHALSPKASVLYRGRLIGHVHYTDDGQLVYYPDYSCADNSKSRKLLIAGYAKLATTTFADSVMERPRSINAR